MNLPSLDKSKTARSIGRAAGGFLSRLSSLLPTGIFVAVWILAPVILNSSAQDLFTQGLSRIVASMLPDAPQVPTLSHDQQVAVDQYFRSYFAWLVYWIVGALATVFIFLFGPVWSHISKEFGAGVDDIRARTKTIDIILNQVTQPRFKERIVIGLFDHLLVYAPLFVAQGLKYFEDEGLDVVFQKVTAKAAGGGKEVGGDKEIADRLRRHEIHFGVSDPIFCLDGRVTPEATTTPNDLFILMPIAKRLGVSVLGRTTLDNDNIATQAKIRIGTYGAPSTTHLVAARFKDWLTAHYGVAEDKIELVEMSQKDSTFSDPNKLYQVLKDLEFILLWQPQLSWVLGATNGHGVDFGLVVVGSDGSPAAWKVERDPASLANADTSGPAAATQAFKPWSPFNHRDKGYKTLASALLTTNYMITVRPELCRRVFRAVSRALMRLEGIDWNIEESRKEGDRLAILETITRSLSLVGYVSMQVLRSMIGDTSKATDGRSIFPFIQGLGSYECDRYNQHLRHLHELWVNDTSADRLNLGDPSELPNINFYGRFLIGADRLQQSGDVNPR